MFAESDEEFGDNVTVAQRLSDAELRWLYENARALVFPSFYEGFGLPVLEAQALGCPVIAARAASIPEVAGEGALFFDPHDTDDLLRRVDAFEADPSIAAELTRSGRINVARFSWEKSAYHVLACVRTMVV